MTLYGRLWTIVPILGYGGFVTNFISTEETEMPNYFILANTIHCNRNFRSRNIRSLNWRPVCVTHQNVSFGSCCILNTTYLWSFTITFNCFSYYTILRFSTLWYSSFQIWLAMQALFRYGHKSLGLTEELSPSSESLHQIEKPFSEASN